MENQNRTERKHSKIKGRTQHRRGAFNSAISFSAGKKRVTFRVPSELKSIVERAAKKGNISVAEFVRGAISEVLPRVEKAPGLPQH
jgi:predicted HicB family RNase H-like nuclease